MQTELKTTYHLEMLHSSDIRPKTVERPGLRVERMTTPCPEFNKFLHTLVGHPHRWGGREHWTAEDWIAYASRDNLHTWVAYVDGTPAGYFEMEKASEGDVEIKSFGLLPAFIGLGLGGHLLTVAVERAWAWGATRVWLHTCTHDHPHALQNYQARGFRVFKIVEEPANAPIPSFWELAAGTRQTVNDE
jgi:GNAT superfamily N-acetyltransferase